MVSGMLAGKVIGGDVDAESVVVLSSMQLPSISSLFMCVMCVYKRFWYKKERKKEREMLNCVFVLNIAIACVDKYIYSGSSSS